MPAFTLQHRHILLNAEAPLETGLTALDFGCETAAPRSTALRITGKISSQVTCEGGFLAHASHGKPALPNSAPFAELFDRGADAYQLVNAAPRGWRISLA